MPPSIKAGFSVVVIVIAVLGWVFRDTIELDTSPILLFGATAFTAAALWLFPEVKNDAKKR